MMCPGHSARVAAEIKRSRFVAHCRRVDSEHETLAFFDAVADQSATHNCWAWRIGPRYRSNDDGEPGGTAGRPILAAIDGRDADHVMVLVSRWYGGIKLGVGGLIRAYGGIAARCLDAAELVPLVARRTCLIDADFNWIGQVRTAIEQFEAEVLEEDFHPEGVRLLIRIDREQAERMKSWLRGATRGEVGLRAAEPG